MDDVTVPGPLAAQAGVVKDLGLFGALQNPFGAGQGGGLIGLLAFLLWGRSLRQAGDHARAMERLDAAAEIYRRVGAGEAWLNRVEEERARL